MPNLWSLTTQKIYEALYGPRTKDNEFNIKVEEIKACERNLQGVKVIFTNFARNTQGIKNYCKDVYTNISIAYSDSSPYWSTIVDITQIHQEMERLYDSLVESVGIISSQTSEWDKNFQDVKKHVALREEYRRTYDHYDEKLEKLVRVRSDKGRRNINETQKEIESFDRNDAKYKKATDDFLKQSIFTYNLMCDLLDFRYKLINPAIANFVNEERKFYTALSDLFKKFDNIQGKFQSLDKQLRKDPNSVYDPRKYVRGFKLLQGVNVNELPNLKMNEKAKEKYTYDDYLKSKSQTPQGNVADNSLNTNKIQESQGNVNKFSYENYINSKNKSPMNYNTNQPTEFQNFNNSYSRDFNTGLNFDINLNKTEPDNLNRTTIMAQPDYNHNNSDQQEDNPYSLLKFNDFTPNNISSSMNMNRINRPMDFSSNINQQRVGQSQMNPRNNNVNNFYPSTSGGFPTNDNKNLKFPR